MTMNKEFDWFRNMVDYWNNSSI